MMKLLINALVLLLAVSWAYAGDVQQRMDRIGFVPGAAPPEGDCQSPVYQPEISSGRVAVKTTGVAALTRIGLGDRSFAGQRFRYEVENRGEFGGELRVVSAEGRRSPLLKGNIQHLLPFGKDLYVFQGLDHLGLTSGSIHVVREFDSAPKLEFLTLMTDAPIQATLSRRGRFFIVGVEALTQFHDEIGLLKVYPYDHFSLRATSGLAHEQDLLVIGTCGGVVALDIPCDKRVPANLEDCSARFYVPKQSR